MGVNNYVPFGINDGSNPSDPRRKIMPAYVPDSRYLPINIGGGVVGYYAKYRHPEETCGLCDSVVPEVMYPHWDEAEDCSKCGGHICWVGGLYCCFSKPGCICIGKA